MAARKLYERGARLRALLRDAAEAIVTTDEHGSLVYINPAAEQIFQVDAEEVIGQSVRRLIPSPHRERHFQYDGDGEASDPWDSVVGQRHEALAQRKDGLTFPIEVSVSEFYLGPRRLFAGIVCDISERKRAEASARQHQLELAHVMQLSTVGEMATTLAHTLNQPLGAIAAYCQASLRMIRAGTPPSERLMHALEQASAQAHRASEILHTIRTSTRHFRADKTSLEPNALVRAAVRFAEPDGRARGVHIVLNLTEHLPLIWANGIHLEQVLINLLLNSIEAVAHSPSPAHEITVSTCALEKDTVRFMVQDTGPGVDTEITHQIFEPFFSTKANNLGMGLTISRSIVEDHTGRLWLEERSPHGATFLFTIPTTGQGSHDDGETDSLFGR